jgi:hypothetical protein
MFDRRDEGGAKTGKAAIGTISRRTERLITAYLTALGANLHPDAILFRNRSGNPYRQDTLADDFGTLREAIFAKYSHDAVAGKTLDHAALLAHCLVHQPGEATHQGEGRLLSRLFRESREAHQVGK